MNVDTGELRRLQAKEALAEGFIEVPNGLEEEAMMALGDKEIVFVNMKEKTPLTAWAKRVRQGRNEKCSCGSGLKYKNCCGK